MSAISHWVPLTEEKQLRKNKNGQWSLFLAGDFCPLESNLSTPVSNTIDHPFWVGSDLRQLISESDTAIVNLEGPIAGAGTPISKVGALLSIDIEKANKLPELGFKIVTLANNHIMDYGYDGLLRTLDWCQSQGIQACGAGIDENTAYSPIFVNATEGVHLAVISACENEFGIVDGSSQGAAWLFHPNFESNIKKASQVADLVIVIAHGGCEEVPFPPIQRRAQMRRFIEAGADLVVGHHAHVPQGWELWGDGLIFYSLGDFYFRWADGSYSPARQWSISLQVQFSEDQLLGVEVIPIEATSKMTVDIVQSDDVSAKRLKYLQDLAVLTSSEDLSAVWQATAQYLWKERYWPYLQQSVGCSDMGKHRSIWQKLHLLFRETIRARTFWKRESNSDMYSQSLTEQLLLLNLLRTESHRWAIETWLCISTGDSENLVTSKIEREFNHFLELMRTL